MRVFLWIGAPSEIFLLHQIQKLYLDNVLIFVCRWCLTILITLKVAIESKKVQA
tara:strand:- start:509 stop:670 length:162 start_codon:yes stop_codon:yes gene_type:complete